MKALARFLTSIAIVALCAWVMVMAAVPDLVG